MRERCSEGMGMKVVGGEQREGIGMFLSMEIAEVLCLADWALKGGLFFYFLTLCGLKLATYE